MFCEAGIYVFTRVYICTNMHVHADGIGEVHAVFCDSSIYVYICV